MKTAIPFSFGFNDHSHSRGVGDDLSKLHPLREAFREKHALQCGYCTPGFLMTIIPFLEENPNPSEAEIREMSRAMYRHGISNIK